MIFQSIISYICKKSDTSSYAIVGMITRTIAFVLLLAWLSLLFYVIFFKDDETKSYTYNTQINHNALSNNSLGILQSKKDFRKQLTKVSVEIKYNGKVLSNNLSNYNVDSKTNKKVSESNKTYRSNISFYPSESPFKGVKQKSRSEETATAIATLGFPKFTLLMQSSYEHFGERKPFDNEQASFTDRHRAPFESNPDFPSDPGDMPLGAGNWVLVIMGVAYGWIKYFVKSKKSKLL